jgi:hypothetical protein
VVQDEASGRHVDPDRHALWIPAAALGAAALCGLLAFLGQPYDNLRIGPILISAFVGAVVVTPVAAFVFMIRQRTDASHGVRKRRQGRRRLRSLNDDL